MTQTIVRVVAGDAASGRSDTGVGVGAAHNRAHHESVSLTHPPPPPTSGAYRPDAGVGGGPKRLASTARTRAEDGPVLERHQCLGTAPQFRQWIQESAAVSHLVLLFRLEPHLAYGGSRTPVYRR